MSDDDTVKWDSLRAFLKDRDIDLVPTDFGAEFDLRIKQAVYPVGVIAVAGFLVLQARLAEDLDKEFAARCLPLLNAINYAIPLGGLHLDDLGDVEVKIYLSYQDDQIRPEESDEVLNWLGYLCNRYSTLIEAAQSNIIDMESAIKKAPLSSSDAES